MGEGSEVGGRGSEELAVISTGRLAISPITHHPSPITHIANWLFRTQEGVLLLVLIALCVVLSRLSPVFASERNIFVLLSQMSMTAITAIGMTLLIIGREVDLSVGSMQAFVGVVAMQALNATSNLIVGLGVAILAGVIVGLVNAGLTLGL